MVFTSTDLEVELCTELLETPVETGQVTVSARKLASILKALPNDSDVQIETSNDQLTVSSGKSLFKLATMPATDFPNLTKLVAKAEFSVDAPVFRTLLAKTQFSMAQKDVRFYLNGLLLEVDGGKVYAVATDGHRLAMSEIELDGVVDTPIKVIIPRKGIQEIDRVLADSVGMVQVRIAQNHIQICDGNTILTTKLIDASYPDYRLVIPTAGECRVEVERQILKEALVRMAILSSEKLHGVRLQLSDNLLTLSTRNPEQESALEEIQIDYQGDSLDIGFNVSYLLDVLNIITTDKVTIELSDKERGVLMTGDDDSDDVYVVMPMRL